MPAFHVAVVLPAYNEHEGLPGFLTEIKRSLSPHVASVSFFVADDVSTDGTAAAVRGAHADAVVETQPANQGHGPTALAAYRLGLKSGADVILHVDGDGQFIGPDFPRVLEALAEPGVDVVHGVRVNRTDPWFRRVLTRLLGATVSAAARRRIPDINTPMRAYQRAALEALVTPMRSDAAVPHVHFSLAESRAGFVVRHVRVESIPRRGATESGTMWGVRKRPPVLPPKRLLVFVGKAARELWRESLRPDATMRSVRRPVEGVSARPL